jgi:hypothetical protein
MWLNIIRAGPQVFKVAADRQIDLQLLSNTNGNTSGGFVFWRILGMDL